MSITTNVRILTKQQWFDNALKGVRSQGYVPSMVGVECRYDGADGRHCAIGWSLVDTDIGAKNEGKAAHSLLCDGRIGVLGRSFVEASNFLSELQHAHDRLAGAPTVRRAEQYEESMRNFAARWEVVYSTPEALK